MSAAIALVAVPPPPPAGGASLIGLVQKGISGDCAESRKKAARMAQIDVLLKPWRQEREDIHRTRAAQARKEGNRERARWYEGRADALTQRYSSRADECGERWAVELSCGGGRRDPDGRLVGCGQIRLRPVFCELRHWCEACIERRRQREYARLIPALTARTREERVRWYKQGRPWRHAPQLRLLTLTARHGETLEETREVIAKSWPKFRRWLHEACGYAPSYAATWETTDSTGGHPHLHVCIVLPFLDVRSMAAAWVQASRGHAEAQGLDLRTVGAKEAARYVAAYVTATALDSDTAPETAAAWVRTTYARRLVMTSRAFWLPEKTRARCDCGCTEAPDVRIVEAPEQTAKRERAP